MPIVSSVLLHLQMQIKTILSNAQAIYQKHQKSKIKIQHLVIVRGRLNVHGIRNNNICCHIFFRDVPIIPAGQARQQDFDIIRNKRLCL